MIVFDKFCKSKKCPEYVEWSTGFGTCRSCKLVGQSYNVTEYPKDCLHLKDITSYEKGNLVLPIHGVVKSFYCQKPTDYKASLKCKTQCGLCATFEGKRQ